MRLATLYLFLNISIGNSF